MTLRTRLSLLTTALLAAVLCVAGVVLERFAARDVERSLGDRVRERARGATPSAFGPAPASPPVAGASAGATKPAIGVGGFGDDVKTLPREADGSHVELFLYNVAGGATVIPSTPRAHAASGPARFGADLARTHLVPSAPGTVAHTVIDGRDYVVTSALAPPFGPGAPPPPQRRPRPGSGDRSPSMGDPARNGPGRGDVGNGEGGTDRPPGGDGSRDEPPPPPPPGEDPPPPPPPPGEDPPPPGEEGPPRRGGNRAVAVVFLETRPALEAHRAFVLRLAGIGVGALLVGGFLSFALAGRMLRPVGLAAAAAEAVTRPTQRLPAPSSNDELGRLVGVLNGMLGRLEAASDRERLFLATASHELRRPLTALLGALELAAAPGRSAEDLRAALALVQGDARAMSRLVDDLLHHARARAGTLRLVDGETGLGDLVADAVRRAGRVVPTLGGIAVAPLPAVLLRVDADAIRQAIENLLVNAGGHGGPGVHVAVRAERDARGLSIHVEDDGPGIPEDEQATIFEPFGRGDQARTVPGSGLGLTIARDVAAAHGGTLTLASPRRPGDAARPGACFTLTLPATRVLDVA